MTIVLGIETSCDETGVGVVSLDDAGGVELLADEIASSVDEHARFGGVVPEVASRAHLQAMVPAVHRALATAGVRPGDVAAVAVTAGPGLAGALLVGVAAAKAYAAAWDVPLYGVNHLAAHVAVDTLQHGPLPPCLALLVSGGHSSLLDVPDLAGPVTPLGATIDDAAGEAFDKVARLLGLPFPGGPHIDRVGRDGDPAAIAFPRGLTGPRDAPFDFSFSGLKTAVARHVEALQRAGEPVPVADVAASFQEAVVDVLTAKAVRAARERGAETMVLGGGVAANSRLRALARGAVQRCGDRAAGAAAAAVHRQRGDGRGPGGAPAGGRREALPAGPAGGLVDAGDGGPRRLNRRRELARRSCRLARVNVPTRTGERADSRRGQALTCASSRTSSSVSLRSSTGSRSASCSVFRALAIGATTVGWAASQASATAATATSCPAAISSSTASTARPRSSR